MTEKPQKPNSKAKKAYSAFLISAFCLLILAGCGKKLPTTSPDDIPGGVRRRAAVELFTATWCTNCPACEQALDLLSVEFGDSITIIEYHPQFGSPQDPFGTAANDQRFSYYGVTAPPVFFCDGVARVAGAVPNLLAEYRSAASGRLAKKSPISIALNGGVEAGSAAYSLTVRSQTDKRLDGLRLLLVLIEDSIRYSAPNGQNLHRHVARRLAPDHLGEAFSLAAGAQFIKSGLLALDPSWAAERMSLAVLIQDEASKEILQSAYIKLFQAVYALQLTAADTLLAGQVSLTNEFPFILRNQGNMGDSIVLDLPDSLAVPNTLVRTLCDRNFCYPLPHTVYLAPGDSLTGLKVTVMPQASGRSTAGLTATPKSSPNNGVAIRFHVEVPR